MFKIFFLTLILFSINQNTLAADNTSGSSDKNTSSISSSSVSTGNSKTFNLSASKINIGLEQLNDVGLDLKNVLTATRHLYDEVMIQPVSVITEPEIIASVVIDIPVGFQPIGPPQPPRKARVDLMMSEIRPVIGLLKQNAHEFMSDSQISNFSNDAQPKLNPLFKKWLAYMDDAYARLLDLEKLTVGPPYDNYAIAEACKLIERDIKQIDEIPRFLSTFLFCIIWCAKAARDLLHGLAWRQLRV